MASQGWTPNEQGLSQVLQLLNDSQTKTSNEEQKRIYVQLTEMKQHSEFSNYLGYILNVMTQLPTEIRQRAGLMLKNNVMENYSMLSAGTLSFIKEVSLKSLADEHKFIRRTTGTLVAKVAMSGGLASWPNLLQQLTQMAAQEGNVYAADGALDALCKICEESPESCDSEQIGRPLNQLIPVAVKLFSSPQPEFRVYALTIVYQFLFIMPGALTTHMNEFVQALFRLTGDDTLMVRKRVCQSFVALVEVRYDLIAAELDNIIKFMIACTDHNDESIALEAAEFWSAYCESQVTDRTKLEGYLPQLVPVLLKQMRYSETDLILMDDELENDQDVEDRPEDVAPRFHRQTAAHGGEAEDEEDQDDLIDAQLQEWNLRKCSAAGMDTLAHAYTNKLLPTLLPLLQTSLQSTGDWPVCEAGILCLGAIANGCFHAMREHLPQLVPYLLDLTNNKQPFVRSISCWTLSRYSSWIVSLEDGGKLLEQFLKCLMERVVDMNKKVQEAACSAFATLEEVASVRMLPYAVDILKTLMFAFGKYQAKNLLILYDALITFCDAMAEHLAQPQLLQLLMPPLMNKWNQVPDDDRGLFPLFECLASVSQSIKSSFAPFAKPVYERAVKIIQSNLQLTQLYLQSREQGIASEAPEPEFLTASLDLLSGIHEGLGAAVEELVAGTPVLACVHQCCSHSSAAVRQSAFALLGDVTICCYGRIEGHVDNLIETCASQLNPAFPSVCNNASWSVGEIAVKCKDRIRPHIPKLLQYLVPILKKHESRPLLENTAITIGRLASVAPEEVAKFVQHFSQEWCFHLGRYQEDHEKVHAFQGLVSVVSKNPEAFLSSFPDLCFALGSWHSPPAELNGIFQQLLMEFRKSLGDEAWQQFFHKNTHMQVRSRLVERYPSLR